MLCSDDTPLVCCSFVYTVGFATSQCAIDGPACNGINPVTFCATWLLTILLAGHTLQCITMFSLPYQHAGCLCYNEHGGYIDLQSAASSYTRQCHTLLIKLQINRLPIGCCCCQHDVPIDMSQPGCKWSCIGVLPPATFTRMLQAAAAAMHASTRSFAMGSH